MNTWAAVSAARLPALGCASAAWHVADYPLLAANWQAKSTMSPFQPPMSAFQPQLQLLTRLYFPQTHATIGASGSQHLTIGRKSQATDRKSMSLISCRLLA